MLKYQIGAIHNIGIQMKRKQLTKIFMMISNLKKNGFYGLYKNTLAIYGLNEELRTMLTFIHSQ